MAAPAAVAGASGLRLRPLATAESLSSPPVATSRSVILSSELSSTFLRPTPLSFNLQTSRTSSPPLPSSSTSRNQFLAFGESRFQCGITHRQRVSCHSSRSSSSNIGGNSLSDRETSRHRERLLPPSAALAGGAAAEGAPGSDTTTGSSTSSSNGKPEESSRGSSLNKVQVAAGAAAVLLLTTIGAAAVLGGGPGGLLSSLSKSGFTAAFSLIFVSEIGDKTFFIAALLAMRYSKSIVLAGAVTALGAMSVISVVIGRLFRELPSQLKTSIPIGEYLACALLVWFGVTSIVQALKLPQTPAPALAAAGASSNGGATTSSQSSASEEEEEGELAEAREYVDKAVAEHNVTTPFAAFWETLTLIFVAEWGDRSMLATIALGAAQSPVGVALGATWGHFVATSIAVVSGAFLSQYISERVVGLVGGVLFLLFAAATLFGIF